MEKRGFDSLSEAIIRAEADVWTALPRDKVLLAHREEDWKKSDPRPIKEWFISEVDAKGPQLRRVVRYLKALRDWQWPDGGPSSVLLMAAAVLLFENRSNRDDLALLDVVAQIPQALRKGISNPTDDTESLTARLGAEKVEDAALHFVEIEKFLRGAIDASDAEQACVWLISKFGSRFPNQPSWVKVVSVAATIAAAPALAGPSELVGRTKAA
jgi:hypothetical protein